MFDEVVTLITNVGFPIACCVVLFVLLNKLTTTISNLNTTMAVINTRLDNIEDALKLKNKKAGDNNV